ncbi:POLR2A [Cordylochernes scorpioides]|uniref:DNA-directed RNA polymerase subunit n=1 Tax=Cordylochernes scorpioides TaxID=51811 RepID=A0ABY6KWW2_9ARAC|nr:POLR2A [Cordylochernes scorpioides]
MENAKTYEENSNERKQCYKYSIFTAKPRTNKSHICGCHYKSRIHGKWKTNSWWINGSRQGSISVGELCSTCRQKHRECAGHFGHIELSAPIFHPGCIGTVHKILQCICFYCSTLLIKPENAKIQTIMERFNGQNRLQQLHELCSKVKKCELSIDDKGNLIENSLGCGKNQPSIKTKQMEFIAEWKKPNCEDETNKIYISASMILEIFSKMSDTAIEAVGMNTTFSRPEWMILKLGHDDITLKLRDIIKANKEVERVINQQIPNFIVREKINALQYHVATMMQNRIKGKEGRIRNNLMGKRVNHSARTVISPDPNLRIDEVGVPISIAKTLTIQKLFTRASAIIRENGQRINLHMNKNSSDLVLMTGDIVERCLINGDVVVFNRQPSLHKMSMMAHKVRILPFSTFRMNLSCTTPYNADFDGDEMNLHVPQDPATRVEVEQLSLVPTQIVAPQANKPCMGIVQDTLTAVFMMTRRDVFIEKGEFMRILFQSNDWDGVIPPPTIIKPKPLWTGKQLFSILLNENINLDRKHSAHDSAEDTGPYKWITPGSRAKSRIKNCQLSLRSHRDRTYSLHFDLTELIVKIRSIFSKAFLSSDQLPFIFKTSSRVLVIPHCMLHFPLKRLRFQQSTPFSSNNNKFRNDIATDGLSRQDKEMEINQDSIGVKKDEPTKERGEEGSRQEMTGRETTEPLAAAISQIATALARGRSDTPGANLPIFDGTYSATQFFQAFDRKMEDASMGEQEKLLRLPNYLARQPLELFRKLRLADRSYFQVRQILLDLYPESSEASFAKYFAMKLTEQANLETYYREKTAMGLQLGLPQEVILETLTEGLPFSDQRLVRVVPPENLREWFRLVQRIHGPSVPGMHLSHRPTVSSAARDTGTANAGIDQSRRPMKKNGQCNQSRATDIKAPGQCKQSQNNQSRVPSNHLKPETPQPSRLFETEQDNLHVEHIGDHTSSHNYHMTNPHNELDTHTKTQQNPLPHTYYNTTHNPLYTPQFTTLLQRYNHIFTQNKFNVPCLRIPPVKIPTNSDKIITIRPYRVPICDQQEIRNQVQQMLENGIIEQSFSPFSSPVSLVTKRDKTKRFCIDYRKVNELISSDVHPLPRIEDILDRLAQAKYFSTADISSAYWQVPIHPDSRPLSYRDTDLTVWHIDDFIIYSNTLEEHQNHLRQFFAFCEAEELQLNFAKCEFFKQSIDFLGYTITAGTTTPLTRNTDIIHAIKQPHNRKTLQSFLGAVNVYNKFIPEYARLRAPLNNLLKKDVVWIWDEACQKAFIDLKGNLTQHPILHLYKEGLPCQVYCDASTLVLKTIKNPSGRLFRWSLRLSSYEYEVRYIKGKQQYEADLLSRNPFCGFLDASLIKTHQPPPSRESSLTIDCNGLHTVSRKGVTKIIIPKPLIQQLLQTVHTQYNQPGISQMSRLISTQYYWQGMSKDIKQKVKTCPTCQLTKRPLGPTYGELSQPPEVKEPFDLLSLDTIAGFAKYGNTKIYLHVVVDHFSRYAWTFPSKSTSITTYQQVLKRVLQDGSPKRLLTDRAPAFTSPKFNSFLLNRNIHPLLTTSNNPQANGLCERLNATLTGKLRLLHLENPKIAWTKLVKRVTVIYNKTPHSTTGFPPIYLMFGILPPELSDHSTPYPDIDRARKIAHTRTQNKHLQDKNIYDQRHKQPHFEVGDLVLVKLYHHPNTGKLAPYFTGPHTVLEIISPNVVRIDRPNQPLQRDTDTIHVNKLKLYTETVRYISPPAVSTCHIKHKPDYTFPFKHFTPKLFPAEPLRFKPTNSEPFRHLDPAIFSTRRFTPFFPDVKNCEPDHQLNPIILSQKRYTPLPNDNKQCEIERSTMNKVRANISESPFITTWKNMYQYPIFHLIFILCLLVLPYKFRRYNYYNRNDTEKISMAPVIPVRRYNYYNRNDTEKISMAPVIPVRRYNYYNRNDTEKISMAHVIPVRRYNYYNRNDTEKISTAHVIPVRRYNYYNRNDTEKISTAHVIPVRRYNYYNRNDTEEISTAPVIPVRRYNCYNRNDTEKISMAPVIPVRRYNYYNRNDTEKISMAPVIPVRRYNYYNRNDTEKISMAHVIPVRRYNYYNRNDTEKISMAPVIPVRRYNYYNRNDTEKISMAHVIPVRRYNYYNRNDTEKISTAHVIPVRRYNYYNRNDTEKISTAHVIPVRRYNYYNRNDTEKISMAPVIPVRRYNYYNRNDTEKISMAPVIPVRRYNYYNRNDTEKISTAHVIPVRRYNYYNRNDTKKISMAPVQG